MAFTMGASELRRYGEVLEARRREVLADIQRRNDALRAETELQNIKLRPPGSPPDEDGAENSIVLMLIETLRKIDAALTRVATHTYGRCAGCKKEIDEARLKALPYAATCLVCEEQKENRAPRRFVHVALW